MQVMQVISQKNKNIWISPAAVKSLNRQPFLQETSRTPELI